MQLILIEIDILNFSHYLDNNYKFLFIEIINLKWC